MASSDPLLLSPSGAEQRVRSESLSLSTLTEEQKRAGKILLTAMRAYHFRKGLQKASADLRASMEGNTPVKLMNLMGESYEDAGLVRKTKSSIVRPGGRLASDWSGGVDTQKKHLEAARLMDPKSALDPIGTTHHTVSDHFLGYIDEGMKRLESGLDNEKKAAQGFRSQVAADSLYASPGTAATSTEHEKALFQVRQNLTYGPRSDLIKGDPGIGFDATFAATGKSTGLKRDYDARSTAIRPMYNFGLLLKSGGYELTETGANHLTAQLRKSRAAHDNMLGGQFYETTQKRVEKILNPEWESNGNKPGIKKTIKREVTDVVKHLQTIPVHGVASGHFNAIQIDRSGNVVDGLEKKKWK
jgi:hypothetical protein